MLVALTAVAGAAPPAPPEPPKPDPLLEIRSAGEEARDLIDLLMPFLARLNFTEQTRRFDPVKGFTTTSFVATNDDFIGVGGRRGCLLLRFIASRTPPGPVRAGVRDRAADFSHELASFLRGLPTPRPVARAVTPVGPPGCAVPRGDRAADHAPSAATR